MNATSLAAELAAAFHASPDDIAANRAGRLGPTQTARLRRSARWNVVGGALIAGVLLLIMLTVADRPWTWAQVVLAVLLGGGGLALGLFTARTLLRSASGGVVERHSGPVTTGTQRNNGAWLRVGDQHLRLPIHPWHVPFETDYHVYVAMPARRIVLIEPV